MEYNKLLQLWNFPFYKLELQTVQVLRKVKLKQYMNNYEIVGVFKFKPPFYLVKQFEKYEKQKSEVIKFLNGYFADKNFVKKYKKTVSTKLGTQTVKFFYVFNLSPDALVDYTITGKEIIMNFNGVMVYKK